MRRRLTSTSTGHAPITPTPQVWQARVASAPAVDAFLASGRDESGFVDLEEIQGRRR
ncbi:hypothetical protein [Streptomyces sp. NPDC057301]|uniref:hypothetical protein n=1 Tax=Streptomyces sp. NPDC057301 TaxID=3346093 RepID=UPI0036403E69